jgi:hypothetical protein
MAILLLLTGGVMSPLYPAGTEKEGVAGCGNYLIISGETNVNRFSFTYTGGAAEAGTGNGPRSSLQGPEILIPVRQFEASNPHMYNDFLIQMQENRFPYISIRFDRFSPGKPDEQVTRTVERVYITLAGVTRQYSIECERITCGTSYILKGFETLRLTDFDIMPPEKLNGLIKVRNEITVSFGIILNFTSEKTFAISR